MEVQGTKLFVVFALAVLASTTSLVKGQVEVPAQDLAPAPAPAPTWGHGMELPEFIQAVLPEDLKCAPACIFERMCFMRNYRSCKDEMPDISFLVCVLASLDHCNLMHVNDSTDNEDNEIYLKKTPHPNSAAAPAAADEGGRR